MPNRESARLGKWIKEARNATGFNREQLGYDKSYIFRVEELGKVPSLKALTHIADVVKVDATTRERWFREAGYSMAVSGEPAPISSQLNESRPPASETDRSTFVKRIRDGIEESLTWLSAAELLFLDDKLMAVVDDVEERWAKMPNDAEVVRLIASHGPEHNLQMVNVLFRHFRTELKGLERNELWLLLAAVWLHDVGLTQVHAKGESVGAFSRYHEYSKDYVHDNQSRLGLSEEEAKALENFCIFHRNLDRLRDLQIGEAGTGMSVERQKVVLALLRLSSIMEVRQSRVGTVLPAHTLPADLESELIRNLFLTRVYRDHHTLRADACYSRSAEQTMVTALKQRLREELQGGLDLVKDVLVLYAKSVLLWAKIDTGPPPSDDVRDHRTHALHLLSTSRSPNAGLVIDTLILALDRLLADSSSRDQATVLGEIRSELNTYDWLRSYQAQIANLRDDLLRILDDRKQNAAKQINEMRGVIKAYSDRKKEAYLKIRKDASALLSAHRSFFLYGYSHAVLAALSSLPEEVRKNAQVFVFEGRPKSNHGPEGKLVYCDGAEYARQVKKNHYLNVEVWPDGTAGWCIGNAKSEKRDPVVLLGAEGIEADSGDVLSTIGTMPVALSARHHGVPIYVFAEGGKIRPGLREEVNDRENRWLTSDDKIPDLLGDTTITVRNVVTERVPGKLVTGILSEKGLLKPKDMAKIKPRTERK